MQRIWEIEGLRGFLAWTVVLSHLCIVLNYNAFNAVALSALAGRWAVIVFVMVSGFVITGLLLERQERWTQFITRRAFRIFPAYLVALAIGAVTTPLAIAGLLRAEWAHDASSWYFRSMQEGLASTDAHPLAHWLLHLTLLQGLVADSVLPWSSLAFVGPAWTLSLEWQFYLVAPLLVAAMRSPKWAIGGLVLAFLGAELAARGVFGFYMQPSMLLIGLWWFVVGIVTRLAAPALSSLQLPLAATCTGLLILGAIVPEIFPVMAWLAFVVIITRTATANAVDRVLKSAVTAVLTSPLAKGLGARSYSTYVIHIPLMKLSVFLLPLQAMGHAEAVLWLAALSLPLTLIASELMYRFVERPMIRLGAALADRDERKPDEARSPSPTA